MVSIKTYETQKVTIILIADDLEFYNNGINFKVKPRIEKVLVGSYIQDISLQGVIGVTKEIGL
jgi:hypothetical protein